MSARLFRFGMEIDGYEVPVLNERAVRAAAGILFLFAFISFMNAFMAGDFRPIRIFVVAFMIDFTIRVFINPLYSPTMILGQWFVRRQQPEYTGAPQKRFAWAIGFALSLLMFFLVVVNNVVGPVNLLVCLLCLTFLFFETAFGICIGCLVYNMFNGRKAAYCPGNACAHSVEEPTKGNQAQWAVLAGFLAIIALVGFNLPEPGAKTARTQSERCKVPDFAKAIGHEEKWKLHNNC